jgi:predicted DNA-binding protein with PD1-like motif
VLLPLDIDERLEFLGGQGFVCEDGDGGRDTHLHGCVADEHGVVRGGHFIKSQNPIFNNLDFAISEISGVTLTRRHDVETDTVEMVIGRHEVTP